MIPIKIVKRNLTGELGTLLQASEHEGGTTHFYPAEQGQYRASELPVVTEKDISDTSLKEKIIYLKIRMTWGDVKNTHIINNGEYIIFEVRHKTKDHPTYFHIYLNFVSVTQCYASLDSAIIGLLDYKYQGSNSQAGYLFERMLQMDTEPTTQKKPEPQPEPKGEPRTFGRSCQTFSSAQNIDSGDKCQYLNQVSGHCNLFNRSVFVLGGKYERLAECKEKYPEKQQGR